MLWDLKLRTQREAACVLQVFPAMPPMHNISPALCVCAGPCTPAPRDSVKPCLLKLGLKGMLVDQNLEERME